MMKMIVNRKMQTMKMRSALKRTRMLITIRSTSPLTPRIQTRLQKKTKPMQKKLRRPKRRKELTTLKEKRKSDCY